MKQRLALGLFVTFTAVAAPARAVEQSEIDRAVSKGVQALRQLQRPDGTWPHQYIGATALAGLTLLECGAKEDDKDVLRAADAVRKASIDLTNTYSVSLSILFLDRLGDPNDEPLIESLTVRLLGGQDGASGGWSYDCPPPSAEDKQRLQLKLNERKGGESRRDSSKSEKKKTGEPSPEIRDQIDRLERSRQVPQPGAGFPGVPQLQPGGADGLPLIMGGSGDNSNTQFAALGLWVGRRHGVPIDRALTRLDRRFRTTQLEDGGWTYVPMPRMPGMPAHAVMPFGMGSTAAMTCAGLIALAIADGATLDGIQKRKPDAKLPDISKDENLNKGLQALGAVIDNPKGLKLGPRGGPGPFPQPPAAPFERVGGRTYYFLWSLERVAVALDLKTIGNKDWYGWGTEILLDNQMSDGSWNGEYGPGGVDTCFALLFLKRANLVRDLTKSLKGRVSDPGERTLRGGTPGKRGFKKMMSGIENKDAKPLEKPVLKGKGTESGRLAEALLTATGSRRLELLETMESEKGVKYTEALAAAIPRLEGDTHRKAREALANRLTRMKDDTLVDYFRDDDPEIRRAAAIAAGQKDSKALVPDLIALLRDADISVVRAAHASLKALTEQDFGPAASATREERDQAVIKWIAWWSKQRKKN